MGNSKRILPVLAALILTLGLAMSLWGCAQTSGSSQSGSSSQSGASTSATTSSQDSDAQATAGLDFDNPGDGYKLQQVVVLSRHNIRAPLSTTGSALDKARNASLRKDHLLRLSITANST